MNRFILWLCIIGAVIAAIYFAPLFRGLIRVEMKERASEKSQKDYHAQIFKDVIRPAAQWVKSFRVTQGRLPTEAELVTYSSNYFNGTYIAIFTNTPDAQTKMWNPGVDFELCVFAPDWNLFYQSCDNKESKHWRH